jgi:hypothetical protein
MHLHYSPFQFATGVEVSTCDVSAHKVAKTLATLTRSDKHKTRNMGATMSCAEAAAIPGTPTAFISPNRVGVMKDISMPLAPMGVCAKPHAAAAYDHGHRHRMREGYGDRSIQKELIHASANIA